jgi:hypothetical protein
MAIAKYKSTLGVVSEDVGVRAPHGVWRFKLDGGKMEGTLNTPENTVFRRVTLRKEP